MEPSAPVPVRPLRPRPHRRRLRATLAIVFLVAVVSISGGCSTSFFTQSMFDELPPVTAEDLARVHEPEGLRADLDALVALHERTNPRPYLRTTPAAIRALADRLKAGIDRPMTRREFLPLVMELQAGYGIDHISQPVPREDLRAALARGERLLPFRAEVRGDELVVVAVAADEKGIQPGERVRRIGGFAAADLGKRLQALVPAESPRFRDLVLSNQFRRFSWIAGVTLPTEVEVVGADGVVRTVSVAGVADDRREGERTHASGAAAAAPAAAASLPPGEVLVDDPPYRCVLLDLPSPATTDAAVGPIAFVDFPTMDSELMDRWNAFLDRAIAVANARGCIGLVVDIRDNGGGDSTLGELLLSRLTDRPYRNAARMLWRRSPESDTAFRMQVKPMWRWLLPIGLPFFMPEYTKLEHGQDAVYEMQPGAQPRVEPSFRGPACLLIGAGTFSSAMMLADAARTYDLMWTVGEPTGGLPNTLGEIAFTQLPNSDLTVWFCKKMFVRASGDEGDLGPVVPHVVVTPVEGRDATLERAVAEIRRLQAEAAAANAPDAPKGR
jgi:Peptidase family S41